MYSRRRAQDAYEPSPPLRLAYDADSEAEKLRRASEELTQVSNDIRTLRQLLESTMNEAQREVFHDIEAKTALKERLAFELETRIREAAAARRSRS